MADLQDVLVSLAALAEHAVYPDGASGISPVTNCQVIIYPGWPDPATLDAELPAGKVHVSIYPRPEERNTTRYMLQDADLDKPGPTLFVSVQGVSSITLSGFIGIPQNLSVVINGRYGYLYAVRSIDTLEGIASALALAINAQFGGTYASGPVINLVGPGINRVVARVGVVGHTAQEMRRQERLFQVSVWASTPALRNAVARPVDEFFAKTWRFALPDNTSARLIYRGSMLSDEAQKILLYRRDLNYTVEYATLVSEESAEIIQERIDVSAVLGDQTRPVTTVVI